MTDVGASDSAPDVMMMMDAGTDSGDASSCPPPSTSLTANCSKPMVSCLHMSLVDCKAPSSCVYIGGARQLLCGSTSDCDGGVACCINTATVTTQGCPNVVNITNNVSNIATSCTLSTSKACAGGDIQVCLTSAECSSGTCQGAVFDINGTEAVKMGICQ